MHDKRKYKAKLGKGLSSGMIHSIPISCAFALLLLSSICINPLGFSIDGNGISNGKAYAEEGISELADNGISLSIDGNSSNDSYSKSLNAVTNQTNYISYNVVATASNIESYSLSIKYTDGSTSLKNSTAGATTINPVISAGVLGKNMTSNTWGWGWSDSTSTANGDMTYRPMQTTDSVIKSATASSANVNGKIVFAANFAEGATAGSYSTNALLSFAIQPKAITTLADITTMQAMTSDICTNTPISNTEYTLTDTRDSKTYTVAKLKDGNCWMTQDLAFAPTNGMTINSAMSDVTSDTTLKVNDNNSYSTMVASSYGYVYGYGLATADTYTSTGACKSSGIASGSICPKNWTLPTGSAGGQFYNLLNGVSFAAAQTNPYNYKLGGYAAHQATSLTSSGSIGVYWSSTGNTVVQSRKLDPCTINQTTAYVLVLAQNTLSTDLYKDIPGFSDAYGQQAYSIRCVAR